MNRRIFIFALFSLSSLGSAPADPNDLTGGVLLVHAPPDLSYSLGSQPCGWMDLTACENQVTRVDSGRAAVWFVLSAWTEEKLFSAVEFGLGDYDPGAFRLVADGVCLEGALAIHSPSAEAWPGPHAGIALASTTGGWTGRIVPICWFAGYAYAGGESIPLGENPATENAGWCDTKPIRRVHHPECMGALGVGREGIRCCPRAGDDPPGVGGPPAMAGGGCAFPDSLRIAEGNVLEFLAAPGPVSFGPGEVVHLDFRDGRFLLNDSLAVLPPERREPRIDLRKIEVLHGSIPSVQQRVTDRDDAAAERERVKQTERRACVMTRRLKSLERHISGWPLTWTIDGGRARGERRRTEP